MVHGRLLRTTGLLALSGCALAAWACMAVANEPEPASAVDPEPEPGPDIVDEEEAPEPAVTAPATEDPAEPEAQPKPQPPTPEEIEALLTRATDELRELGVRKKPIRHLRGPHPEPSGLDEAYADKRVIGYEGKLEEVRTWMGLAKFGLEQATHERSEGPLARYDLCVTRKGDSAWLHVIVPAAGLAVEPDIGQHYKAESRERWVLLSDRAQPGVDYLPFKRSAAPSLSRQWGREKLVDGLIALARDYKQQTGVRLGIGDISHVTGGKMRDHWTHRVGADVDVYLLDYPDGDDKPVLVYHSYRRSRSVWSTKADGKGTREQANGAGETVTSERLRALAQLVFENDDVAYFVHNDPVVLDDFDDRVGERKPGRRFLHAKNRGYWPQHADHVHLRWIDGPLPVGVAPRP